MSSSRRPRALVCAGREILLAQPAIMGVINVTPDSFSDGGQLIRNGSLSMSRILRRAERMFGQGAVFLDVGGESTRPGAAPVSEEEELLRVLPVVSALTERFDVVVSVDTSSPSVMQAAIEAGAGLINDVRALRRDGALQTVAGSSVAVCVMHMPDEPDTMQTDPHYNDVCSEVRDFLSSAVGRCEAAGIDSARVMIDPGFGFGKTLQHNLQLFNGLPQLCDLPYPVLVGVSRKSMIGAVTGRPAKQRMAGGLSLAVLAVKAGAAVIRTHDVAATRDALLMLQALEHEH